MKWRGQPPQPVGEGPLTADGRQFIFIHVPKTAGTSVGRALKAAVPAGWRPGPHIPAYTVLEIRRDWFSFAFVRNPWDRMVSLWRFAGPDKTLREFIIFSRVEPRPFSEPFKMQQTWFINDQMGKPLVSFIGRFEQLHTDFSHVCHEIGIEVPTLGHFNRTEHTNYRDYYDAETREMMAADYAQDIDTFGYRF